MAKKVIVFMAEGFEEMELTISVDILRRAGLDVKACTIKDELTSVKGSRGILMQPDVRIDEIDINSFDAIVLPGGLEGTKNLGESEKVLQIVKEAAQQNKLVAAICAAPVVLVKAGLASGRTLTSHPAAQEHMVGVNYSEDRVCKDGNIVTSRAAGTAFEFAFALLKELCDDKTVREVNKGVLAKI
ncbi:MAG: DJ-1 family glyoxalase III [Candidatus Rifleibacteriota bacterium]